MPALRLTLFGSPKLERDGLPLHLDTRKSMALLVYLAMSGQEQSREALAALFWPEQNEGRARASLRRALSSIRQTLGADVLLTSRTHASFRTEQELYVDALAYGQLTEPCSRQSEILDNVAPCIEPLTQAVALYGSDFLAGFTLPDCPQFDEWHFFQAESLRRSLAHTLQTLSHWHTAQQEYEPAIDFARRRLALDRLHEPAQRRLMELYALSGQQAAAVRQYEECVRVLDEELGVLPQEETAALFEAIRSRRFPFPLDAQQKGDTEVAAAAQDLERPPFAGSPLGAPVATGDRHQLAPSNLPPQPTPFVGREQELSDILRRLQDPDCRLLTLVGPGGIGKTRLAIESAQRLLHSPCTEDRFVNGIFFVSLQPVSTQSGIVSAIAEAANFRFYSDVPPREQLLDYLRRKRMLLLLDNFEHLLASADLVAEILTTALAVKILATSREALKLRQEWFQPMTGMRFSRDPAAAEQAVSDYDAVRLFAQNARRAQPRFPLMQEEDHIVRICRLVEGMPLGIELAAAWLKILPCAQIANEIERGLDILTARHQDMPERHRSMRVLLEQSWQLLSEDEQDVLERLSVFQGGFRRGAAAEIAGASLLTLATLVEKSLLQATQSGRYQMHELLRQFAQEKLAENRQEETSTLAQHSTYYLDYVSARQEMLNGPELQTALEEIGAEIDNIRAAWAWAVEQEEWESLDQALHGLYDFYQIRSRFHEGCEDIARAVSPLDRFPLKAEESVRVRLLSRLLAHWGALYYRLGDYDQAEEHLEAALTLPCEAGEYRFALHFLGGIARFEGQRQRAETLLRQSLAIGREIGDLVGQVHDLYGLAGVSLTFGKLKEAQSLAGEALVLSRRLGTPHLTARVQIELGAACTALGEYTEAIGYLRESQAIFRQLRDDNGMARALYLLGLVEYSMGGQHLSQAVADHEQSQTIFRLTGDRGNMVLCLGSLTLAACEHGDYALAMERGLEGVQIAEEIGHLDMVCLNLWALGAVACAEGDLAAARAYLSRSLTLSLETEIPHHVSGALLYLANVMVAEGEQFDDAAGKVQKQAMALTYLTSILPDPRIWQFLKDRATALATRLRPTLSSKVVSEVDTRVAQTTLEELAAEMLNAENGT